MKLHLFSIHDSKAHAFNPPQAQQHVGLATRTLSDLVNDPQSIIGKHPGDFRLYVLGSLDTETGIIEPTHPPQLICDAESLKETR